MNAEPTRGVAVAAATDIGRVRRRNEDHALVATTVLSGDHAEHAATVEPPAVVAVMDGLGGHPAGDVASGIVARVLAEADVPVDGDDVDDLVATMQERLARHMREDPETVAMGTTLVGASLLDATSAMVIGIGDSVALWWDGALHLAVELDRSPGGWITQTLGGGLVDDRLEPHLAEVTGPGRLLLASDGLTDLVDVDTIADVLRHHDAPADVVGHLVATALERGGHDNITIVVADLLAP